MRFRLISHLPLLVFPLLLGAAAGKPFVYLVFSRNATCLDAQAMPACFGPPLSEDGLKGYLFEAEPANACLPIRAPPDSKILSPGRPIVLIRRYNCSFGLKVYHAQEAGYRAAIIHNLRSDLLVSMSVKTVELREQIDIPSLFVGESASRLLREAGRAGHGAEVRVVVPWSHDNPCWDNRSRSVWDPAQHPLQNWPGYCARKMVLAFVAEYGAVIFLSAGVGLLVVTRCVRWLRKDRGAHVKTFRGGDKHDPCVICMAEYEDGDRLKILPCAHAYHSACINTWLLMQPKAGRICPICKQHVDMAA